MQSKAKDILELQKQVKQNPISVWELISSIDDSKCFYIYQITKDFFAVHLNKSNIYNVPANAIEVDIDDLINAMDHFNPGFFIGSINSNELYLLNNVK